MSSQLISVEQLSNVLGISRATIYRQIISNSDFPRPVRIGASTRFKESEVQAFIEKLGQADEGHK